jgi:histidine triad (HIT) family protein
MEACPFCDDQTIRERIVAEDDYIRAFPTNIPIVPMHMLLVPIRHITALRELSPEERSALFDMIDRLQKMFRTSFGIEGFNFAWNEGVVAGQNVEHFHLHLLPRVAGDTGITEYEPRKFLYRPGSRETAPQSELLDVAKTLREALEK